MFSAATYVPAIMDGYAQNPEQAPVEAVPKKERTS
jgi:hypothetical protein